MPMSTPARYDVCIIGTGRVGLPLGLSLIDAGLDVVGVDRDPAIRRTVNAGEMPFAEPGYDALINARRLMVHDGPAVAADSAAIVITVGTPLRNHIESDLRQIDAVLDGLAPHLRAGQLVCLRSTVAPRTTRYVAKRLAALTGLRIGDELRLAFCPERIAEGRARTELRTLPQIVGADDPASAEAAEALFAHLAPEVLHADSVSAELVKLFNNIARYVHFAVANQFALIADTFGANIHAIRRLANHRYPRDGIAPPGLTAGTCLRKDFGMVNEWSPHPDLLLAAWKMNEYVPAFLVQHLEQRLPLEGRTVAVLGYSFKRDSDDVRDSLVPKLVRYIERCVPAEVRVSDHNLPDPLPAPAGEPARPNFAFEAAVRDADAVFVAVNHSLYPTFVRRLPALAPAAWIVDLWDVGGTEQTFYRSADLRPTTHE